MTKEEALKELMPLMDKYVADINNLMKAAFTPTRNPKDYVRGVFDGIENSVTPAFRAGAKAMYDLLTRKADGTSDNV
jgi:hypothetical protein